MERTQSPPATWIASVKPAPAGIPSPLRSAELQARGGSPAWAAEGASRAARAPRSAAPQDRRACRAPRPVWKPSIGERGGASTCAVHAPAGPHIRMRRRLTHLAPLELLRLAPLQLVLPGSCALHAAHHLLHPVGAGRPGTEFVPSAPGPPGCLVGGSHAPSPRAPQLPVLDQRLGRCLCQLAILPIRHKLVAQVCEVARGPGGQAARDEGGDAGAAAASCAARRGNSAAARTAASAGCGRAPRDTSCKCTPRCAAWGGRAAGVQQQSCAATTPAAPA